MTRVDFFCPRCGAIWCSIPLRNDTEFRVWKSSCSACRPWLGAVTPPGSVLEWFIAGDRYAPLEVVVDLLPDSIIQQEFFAQLNHLETENGYEESNILASDPA